MLYRTPRLSAVDGLRAAFGRLGGALAGWRKTGADTAYLDGLSDDHLRELGLRRSDDRHFHQTRYR